MPKQPFKYRYMELRWHAARLQHRLVPQGATAYAILIVSHTWESVMLFPSVHDFFRRRARRLLDVLERTLRRTRANEVEMLNKQVVHRVVIGICIFVLAIIEVLGSWTSFNFL